MTLRSPYRHGHANKTWIASFIPLSIVVAAGCLLCISTHTFAFQNDSGTSINNGETESILEAPPLEGPGAITGALHPSNSRSFENSRPKVVIQPPISPDELETAPEDLGTVPEELETAPEIASPETTFGSAGDEPPSVLAVPQFDDDLWTQESPSLPPQQLEVESDKQDLPNRAILGVYGSMIDGWGFKIQAVVAGSTASKMKLEPGDVILSINGKTVTSVQDLQQQLQLSLTHNGGIGVIGIDNIRGRYRKSCQRSCSVRASFRFQSIRFRL